MPSIPTAESMPIAQKTAAIVAITQLFKYYGAPSKFCPAIAIGLGILFEYSENPTSKGVITGVILGATVTGGYGLIKRTGQCIVPMQNSHHKKPEPVKMHIPSINTQNLEHDDDRTL